MEIETILNYYYYDFISYTLHGTAFGMTRVIKCRCAGVGETGGPREKPTNKPIFKGYLAATYKLEHLLNHSQGEAWQSRDVISDLEELTQDRRPPRFFLWK